MTRDFAVQTRSLTVRRGRNVALDDVDLDIPLGQRTVVIGPNGSGKSTLLGAISGLHAPTTGTVEVLDGEPVSRRRRIAHVLQTAVVNESIPISVREVVAMGTYPRLGLLRRSSAARRAVDDALERLDITDLAGRHLAELSGGQRQRVMVAQGIVQDADLLLLDEPLTGLDVSSVDRIERIIDDELGAGRTVVVTTHDLTTALEADNVVLLATRVIAAGPPSHSMTEEHLATAYGGHVHELPGGTQLLDDPAHH